MLIMHAHECANARSGDRAGKIARGRIEDRETGAPKWFPAARKSERGRKKTCKPESSSCHVERGCRERRLKSRKDATGDPRIVEVERSSNPVRIVASS